MVSFVSSLVIGVYFFVSYGDSFVVLVVIVVVFLDICFILVVVLEFLFEKMRLVFWGV